jgi:hypothetical protein
MPWNARAEQLLASPGALCVIREIARGFVSDHDNSLRASSWFASTQRWLMSHIAMKLHFIGSASAEGGLTRHNFVQAVVGHELASRNTARAVFAEAIKYGFTRAVVGSKRTSPDDGMLPVELTEPTIGLLADWYVLHLRALDALCSARRLDRFPANPLAALAVMEPLVCDGLLTSMDVRSPGPVYSLFTWMDQGGPLMDRLMAGIDCNTAIDGERSVTDVTSMSELARALALSRSHVARKLVDGESAGHVGWTGRRGHSAMWVSSGFRKEYARAQALKLAIIDSAFASAFASEDSPLQPRFEHAGPDHVSKMGGDRSRHAQ